MSVKGAVDPVLVSVNGSRTDAEYQTLCSTLKSLYGRFSSWRRVGEETGVDPAYAWQVAHGHRPSVEKVRAMLEQLGIHVPPTHRTIAFRLPIDEAAAFDAWCQQFGDTRREQARRMVNIMGMFTWVRIDNDMLPEKFRDKNFRWQTTDVIEDPHMDLLEIAPDGRLWLFPSSGLTPDGPTDMHYHGDMVFYRNIDRSHMIEMRARFTYGTLESIDVIEGINGNLADNH